MQFLYVRLGRWESICGIGWDGMGWDGMGMGMWRWGDADGEMGRCGWGDADADGHDASPSSPGLIINPPPQ